MKQEAIEFPTLFPIKVIGRQSSEFQAMVVEVIRRHVADLDEGTIHLRASAGGRYISLIRIYTAIYWWVACFSNVWCQSL